MERGRIPPVERKKERKKGKLKEREGEKERHLNKEALELMERGYKSEHRSLTPKETLRAQSGASESVLEWGGGWRRGAWTVMLKQEGRATEGEGVQPPCLGCKFVPVASQARGEGPLLLFLYME